VDLIAGFEEHPQTLAWSDFIINDEDFGGIRAGGDVHCSGFRARGVPFSL
jgi:hypothetical protein